MSKFTKFALRSVIAAMVLLGLVEAGLWLFSPVAPDAGMTMTLSNALPGFKQTVTFAMGPDQLRRDGWEHGSKKEGVFRVVCIGGSQTVSLLQNVEDSWWGQLRQKLEVAHPGKKFEIGALGIDSKGILFGAKWAETFLSDLEPDLVIAQYGIEDVLLQPQSYEYDKNRLENVSMKRKRTGLKGIAIQMSQICRRVSHSRAEHQQRARSRKFIEDNFYAVVVHNSRRVYRDLDLAYSIPRLENRDPVVEFKDGLSGIVTAARGAGAKVLIVGEPSLVSELSSQQAKSLMMYPMKVEDPLKPVKRPRPGWVESELLRYYLAAASYAAEVRVPFVNLHIQVPQDGNHFLNEMILTDLGAQKVAELLLPEVEKLLVE